MTVLTEVISGQRVQLRVTPSSAGGHNWSVYSFDTLDEPCRFGVGWSGGKEAEAFSGAREYAWRRLDAAKARRP